MLAYRSPSWKELDYTSRFCGNNSCYETCKCFEAVWLLNTWCFCPIDRNKKSLQPIFLFGNSVHINQSLFVEIRVQYIFKSWQKIRYTITWSGFDKYKLSVFVLYTAHCYLYLTVRLGTVFSSLLWWHNMIISNSRYLVPKYQEKKSY